MKSHGDFTCALEEKQTWAVWAQHTGGEGGALDLGWKTGWRIELNSLSVASLPSLGQCSPLCQGNRKGKGRTGWRDGVVSGGSGWGRGREARRAFGYGGAGRCGTSSCWHLKGMFSANSFLVCSLGLLSSRYSPIVVVWPSGVRTSMLCNEHTFYIWPGKCVHRLQRRQSRVLQNHPNTRGRLTLDRWWHILRLPVTCIDNIFSPEIHKGYKQQITQVSRLNLCFKNWELQFYDVCFRRNVL